MNDSVIERLSVISDEENKILSRQGGVNRKIYTSKKDFTIDSNKMFEHGKLINVRTHTRFIDFPVHNHNFVEIIYMCSGSTTHLINDTEEVVLNKGELLFLNQFTSHSILPATKDDIAVNVMVLPQFFDEAFDIVAKQSVVGKFLSSTLCSNTEQGKYIHFKCADIISVQNLMENMIVNLLDKRDNVERIDRLTMAVLLLELINCTQYISQEKGQNYDNAIIFETLKYIEVNYKTARLSEISKTLCVPDYKLCKLIKQYTQKTFATHLLDRRLEKSIQLLDTTKLSVSDIITAVGYDNTSYFYRVFKDKYGVTPTIYRIQNRT